MRRFSREEWEILRRSTVMVGPGQPAPFDRETALVLFHQLAKLAERDRRTRALVDELQRVLDLGPEP